jgi:hypothetical protein
MMDKGKGWEIFVRRRERRAAVHRQKASLRRMTGRKEDLMKKSSAGLMLSAAVWLLALTLPGSAHGQTAARAKAAAAPPKYDVAREVMVEGTVASVVTKPVPGLLAGAHAFLATASGPVDAHLGTYALRGTPALALAVGEKVTMVGVMQTVQGRPVLLVRTVKTGSGQYTIRNAHGILTRSASACATRPDKDGNGGRS